MPALPPMRSRLSPKVTSSLANTDVEAVGLEEVHPSRDLAPHVLEVVLEVEGSAGRDQRCLIVVERLPRRLPMTNGSMLLVHSGNSAL
jgi:hypothetical protein